MRHGIQFFRNLTNKLPVMVQPTLDLTWRKYSEREVSTSGLQRCSSSRSRSRSSSFSSSNNSHTNSDNWYSSWYLSCSSLQMSPFQMEPLWKSRNLWASTEDLFTIFFPNSSGTGLELCKTWRVLTSLLVTRSETNSGPTVSQAGALMPLVATPLLLIKRKRKKEKERNVHIRKHTFHQ